MLSSIQSAGVAPEVNLGNPLHTGDKAHSAGCTLPLKPWADITRSPKQRCQWPHEKGLCPETINFKFNRFNRSLDGIIRKESEC